VITRNYYKLKPHGKLLWTKAAFGCQNSDLIITARLLIDTGATFTALSDRLVKAIVETPLVLRQEPIITASDRLMVPVIAIPWMNCLGQQINNFPMISLPIPHNAFIDGLIGIDFLRQHKGIIDIEKSEISVIQ
jgi:aspartyl protease family protein